MQKPLLRWVIGDVHDLGFHVLKKSVKRFLDLYGNEFDYLICYNNLPKSRVEELSSIGIDIYDQTEEGKKLFPPISDFENTLSGGAIWKICPPRLRKESHEIVLDNDIILRNRHECISNFLNSDSLFLVTEALDRLFGKFDSYVPEGIKLNTGFYGLPPNYDFKEKIEKLIFKSQIKSWESHWDKQGLVAACIVKENYEVISLDDISVCWGSYNRGKFGDHFPGVNSGVSDYWNSSLPFHL